MSKPTSPAINEGTAADADAVASSRADWPAAAAPAATSAVTMADADGASGSAASASSAAAESKHSDRPLPAPVAIASLADMNPLSSSPLSLLAASRRCTEPIALSFRDLTATMQERDWRGRVVREHTIIKNISARFEPGKLIGIMGGSGSGKTSLLNLLANRGGVRQSCKCSGSILFNGRPGDLYGKPLEAAAASAAFSSSTKDASLATAAADISAQQSHNALLDSRIGYVLQQEYLLPHLSVFETLFYAAQLRLSREYTTAQKRARVEEIILELNLKAVRDSLVGDEHTRGISGGEKRRVSVAVQMLIDPSVLFLDEPTTGLDAFTALNIVETLSALAHSQLRTVIATIHQPRSSIYSAFDEIVLMVRGHVIFQGSPAQSIAFFEQQGYAIPGEVNPVDFMLDVLTIDGRSEIQDPVAMQNGGAPAGAAAPSSAAAGAAVSSPVVAPEVQPEDADDDAAKKAATVLRRERAGLARVRRLKRAFDAQQKERPPVERLTTVERADRTPIPLGSDADAQAVAASSQSLSLMGARTPTQVALLVRRTFLSLLRDRNFLGAQLISNLFVALMLGFLFYNLPYTSAGVRSRVAATYMISTLLYYLQMIYFIYKFSLDLPIADHEREDGMYSAFSFVCATLLSYLPFHLLFSLIYMSTVYFLIGLRTDEGSVHFWVSAGVAALMLHCCAALSFMCVCLQRSFAQASLTANSFFTFFGLSTGFLISSQSIPPYLKWIQPLSYTWYGWRIMASNEFSGRTLPCIASEQPSQSCLEFEGARILHASSLGVDDYTAPCVALLVFWGVCITIGYLALVFAPKRSSMAGEGAALGAGASGAVEEKAYDLDAAEEGEAVDSQKQQKQSQQQQQQQQQLLKPQALKPPPIRAHSADLSASGVVFIGGPDNDPIALSRPNSPERDLEAVHAGRSASPLVARAETPGREVAASALVVQVNGTPASPVPAIEPEAPTRSLGVRRLSHDGQVSLRPLITLTLNNLCLSVVKRRALDLSCAGFGEGDAALSKAERTKPLKILNGVTATIEPGRLVVLMGSSGSGKSTLLDILSHRSTLLSQLEGEVLFNQAPLAKDVWESVVGYVMQSDHLLPFLTVEETLRFAAHLRLPPETTQAEREARVADVIAELGLQLCKHTMVGSKEVKGISGGEKRRLSIGVQMLTDPSVLLLDEPTSGLDSFTAFQITKTLSRIAKRGRTVLCSIHQPRSDVYALFDRIMLLAPGGSLVYYGSRASVAPYFAAAPLHMHSTEAHTNRADWLLDNSSLDYRTESSEKRTIARNQRIIDQFKSMQSRGMMIDGNDVFRSEDDVVSGHDKSKILSPHSSLSNSAASRGPRLTLHPSSDGGHGRKRSFQLDSPGDALNGGAAKQKPQQEQGEITLVRRAPFGLAFRVLLRRSWLNFARQPLLVSTRIGQIFAFAVILMLYYTRLGFDQNSVQNRLGLLQEFTALLFIGMLNNIAIFPAERNIFYREYSDRSYGTMSFILSYTLSEIMFELFGCVLFAVVAMYVIGMQASASAFFVLLYTLFCTVHAGESLGIVFCSLVFEAGISVSIANCFMTYFTVMIGVFSLNMPDWLRGINKLSMMKYAANVVARNELSHISFHCETDEMIRLPDGSMRCHVATGQEVIELYRFNSSTDLEDLLCVGLLCLGYRLIAFATLHWSARKKHFSG